MGKVNWLSAVPTRAMTTSKQLPPEHDAAAAADSAHKRPPLYAIAETLVEPRINADGQVVRMLDGREVVIRRRQRGDA